MARPTKYNNEIPGRVLDYIENHKEYGDVVPTVAGLACFLKLHIDTLYDWAKQPEKQEFSEVFKLVMQHQQRKLINGGLGGEYNSNITKLMLAKHGYHEKAEETQEKQPISITIQNPHGDNNAE